MKNVTVEYHGTKRMKCLTEGCESDRFTYEAPKKWMCTLCGAVAQKTTPERPDATHA